MPGWVVAKVTHAHAPDTYMYVPQGRAKVSVYGSASEDRSEVNPDTQMRNVTKEERLVLACEL